MNIANFNYPVPENINRIIQEKGMKKCVVAERAGYKPQTFNDMLNGRKIMKAIDIKAIAEVLTVEPNELFIAADEPKAG